MNIQSTSTQSGFNPVNSIQKCQNIRYQWEQDFNKNYTTLASRFASKLFEDIKKEFGLSIKLSLRSIPTIENRFVVSSINFLKLNELEFAFKENKLEPFWTWYKTYSENTDYDYFHNLMKIVGNQSLMHLSEPCKNYFSPDFECEIKIVSTATSSSNNWDKYFDTACIVTSIWAANKNNLHNLNKLVKVSTEKDKVDLNSLLLDAEKIKIEWQKEFNANHMAFALEIAEHCSEIFLEKLAEKIENPYISLKINEKFGFTFNIDIKNRKNNIIKQVATQTKKAPFYHWFTEYNCAAGYKEAYFYKGINEVVAKAMQLIPELLQNKLLKDFKFSLEEYVDYKKEKNIRIAAWMVSIPVPVVHMTQDLWIKKNN
jgi:hypothetical protein